MYAGQRATPKDIAVAQKKDACGAVPHVQGDEASGHDKSHHGTIIPGDAQESPNPTVKAGGQPLCASSMTSKQPFVQH